MTSSIQKPPAAHTPGPMEQAVRDMAYLGETDGLILTARHQDAIRADLLAALEACAEYLGSPANQAFGSYDGDIAGAGHLAKMVQAAISAARGEG